MTGENEGNSWLLIPVPAYVGFGIFRNAKTAETPWNDAAHDKKATSA